jgi:hypothetical protein
MVLARFVLWGYVSWIPVGLLADDEGREPRGDTLRARVQRLVDQDQKRYSGLIGVVYDVISDLYKRNGLGPFVPDTDPANIQARVLEIRGPEPDPQSREMMWRVRYEFDVPAGAVDRVIVGAIAFRPPVGQAITSKEAARTFIPVGAEQARTVVCGGSVPAIVDASGRSRLVVALLAYDAKANRLIVLAAQEAERSGGTSVSSETKRDVTP